MSLARLNVTELYRVEGTIIKVDMAEYHFGKPGNMEKLQSAISRCVLDRRFFRRHVGATFVLAVRKRGVFVLQIFPRAGERCIIECLSLNMLRVCFVFDRSQEF